MNAVLVVIALLVAVGLAAMFVWSRVRSGAAHKAGPGISKRLDDVQFTVYRPRAISADRWYPLIAFAHLTGPLPGDPAAPDPLEEVQRQAERILDRRAADYRPVSADSTHQIPRSAELTVVPRLDGVEFNPSRGSFRWEQPVHKAEFQLRALPDTPLGVARGQVTFFLGSIIVGDVPLAVPIVGETVEAASRVADRGHSYRKIFASYSHLDGRIVEQFEDFMRSLGDQYVRDVRDLRAGELWSSGIENLIRDADVFQLFWSWNALASPFVRREWEFALGLDRAEFVRPVYWEDPLPSSGDLPPDELRRLHFYRLSPRATDGGGVPGAVPPSTARWVRRWSSAAAALALAVLALNAGVLWIWGHRSAPTSPPTAAVPPAATSTVPAAAQAPPTWSLTIVKPQGGTIIGKNGILCGTHGSNCSVNLPEGEPVTLQALSDAGHTFVKYTGDCSAKGATTMAGDRTCSATFAPVSAKASAAEDGPLTGSAPAPVTLPGSAELPRPTVNAADHARRAIEQLASHYCAAIGRRDPSEISQIYPRVDEAVLREQFQAYRSVSCTIAGPFEYDRLDVAAGQARVRFALRQNVVDESGRRYLTEATVTMVVSRANEGSPWLIDSIDPKW
jgi:TIR domain/Divergent InlB B-repeat domain